MQSNLIVKIQPLPVKKLNFSKNQLVNLSRTQGFKDYRATYIKRQKFIRSVAIRTKNQKCRSNFGSIQLGGAQEDKIWFRPQTCRLMGRCEQKKQDKMRQQCNSRNKQLMNPYIQKKQTKTTLPTQNLSQIYPQKQNEPYKLKNYFPPRKARKSQRNGSQLNNLKTLINQNKNQYLNYCCHYQCLQRLHQAHETQGLKKQGTITLYGKNRSYSRSKEKFKNNGKKLGGRREVDLSLSPW